MHHIFVAHSFITYLVGRLTAMHLGLSRDQQTIIQARNFQTNPTDCDITLQFPFPVPPNPFPTFKRVDKAWKRVRVLDKFITKAAKGNEFTFYSFDTSTRYNQLIYRRADCKKMHVLEEGGGSYRNAAELENLYKWERSRSTAFWDSCCYGGRFKPAGFLEPATEVYTLTEQAFPGVAKKTVVYDKEHANQICNETKQELPDDSVIIAHDWSTEHGLKQYIGLFMHAMERYRGRTIFQKFHPQQSESSIETINKANRLAGYDVETISSPLESYIFDNQTYDFLGHHSSTLIYAKLFGKSARSVFDFDWGTVWDSDGYVFDQLGRPKVNAVL